jgi:succinate-semialdehyde dehydrogenase / glutarate-semialdehyde dehydrogenase
VQAESCPRFDELLSLVSSSDSDGSLEMVSPLTGRAFGKLPVSSASDVRDAVRRARQAQRAWAAVRIGERIRLIERFARLVAAYQELVMDVVQIETGKTRQDALEEVLDVQVTASYYTANAAGTLNERRLPGAIPGLTAAQSRSTPYGVVGMITPWNYPFTLFASDSIPALLAGNGVVVKPSEETPLSALVTLFLFRAAGFPEDLIQAVAGTGEVGASLVDEADFVQFTGSTSTGRKVAEAAGRALVPASLELGGKNPMLVLSDSSMEAAVSGALKGCFANAGQLCIAVERLYVQNAIYDEFKRRFVAKTRRLMLGSGPSYAMNVGSLISESHLSKVREHVDDAAEHGATILCGGVERPDIGPYFFEPTVLENVSTAAKLHREETFGPIVALYRFETVDEAVSLANDSPYGLHASVWSSDGQRAEVIAKRLEFGTVGINDAYLSMWGSTAVPMGGVKSSGLGRRHGSEGILKYTQSQSVVRQHLHPLSSPPHMSGQAFARAVALVARIRRILAY